MKDSDNKILNVNLNNVKEELNIYKLQIQQLNDKEINLNGEIKQLKEKNIDLNNIIIQTKNDHKKTIEIIKIEKDNQIKELNKNKNNEFMDHLNTIQDNVLNKNTELYDSYKMIVE